MDPTATLRAMREALSVGDFIEANQHAINLRTWLARGGFRPEGWTQGELARLCNAVTTLTSFTLDEVS